MEVIENKGKYVRHESRWQKTLRVLRKFFWIFPLLAIAAGLLIAWQLIRKIQAEGGGLPGVQYEEYLEPEKKPKKEVRKLELYREKMKKEKEQQITSRYDRIISGREIVGKVDYGTVVPSKAPAPEQPVESPSTPPPEPEQLEVSEEESNKSKVQATEQETSMERDMAKEQEKMPGKDPLSDSLTGVDTLRQQQEQQGPFHILKASSTGLVQFTKAHFYGDQDIRTGSYIRLRLGEDMLVQGKRIPRNTIFRGIASLSQNKIEIRVDQIGSQEIKGMIYDQDLQAGIVIPASKREGMEEAINRTLYQTGSGSAMDLPYQILQDVSRNIIRNKQRKQSLIRINDGYLVYITLNPM